MWEKLPFDDYDLLRYGIAGILLVNALHRIYHPETNIIYIAEPIITGFPGTAENFTFIVHMTALILLFLIIMDIHTHFAAAFLGFGLSMVVLMLLVQTPYIAGATDSTVNKMFFDVALRNTALVLLCIAIARMSIERQEGIETFWQPNTSE